MERKKVGHFEITMVGDEQVRAFVPRRLPPEPSLDLSHMQRELERASLALGQLDSESRLLPDPDLFVYAYVRREAQLSSQIEGTQSSLSDLFEFELKGPAGVWSDDETEVSNYVAALEHGLKRVGGGFPLSNRLIREMHGVLLRSGRGSGMLPGEFRRSQTGLEARDQAMPSMFHRPTRKWNAACPNWNSSFTPRATAFQRWFGQEWRTPSSSPFTHFSTAMGESDGC